MTLPQPALGSLPGAPSDEGWVAASLNGSGLARKEAYSNLVRRHEGPVRNLLRHLCRSYAIADELAQDAFLTGWLKLTTLRNPQTFGAWIRQIAYREFLHSARTLRLEHKSTHETVGELQVEATNLDDDLEALLAVCSPTEREIMVLQFAFEFTQEEIAVASDMAVGTVKSHVHRAKQKIRAHLDAVDNDLLLEECRHG